MDTRRDLPAPLSPLDVRVGLLDVYDAAHRGGDTLTPGQAAARLGVAPSVASWAVEELCRTGELEMTSIGCYRPSHWD